MSEWRSPWLSNGSLISFPIWDPFEWRDKDYEWWEALRLDAFERGRSAAHLIFTSAEKPANDRTYPMFLVDFVELVKTENLVHGFVRCKWRVVKRGQNYGIAKA